MLEDTNSLDGAHLIQHQKQQCTKGTIIAFGRYYRNEPKFSDRYAWANNADPDQTEEQSDHGLHCLPFRLHRLD